jgi:hypothetical protein
MINVSDVSHHYGLSPVLSHAGLSLGAFLPAGNQVRTACGLAVCGAVPEIRGTRHFDADRYHLERLAGLVVVVRGDDHWKRTASGSGALCFLRGHLHAVGALLQRFGRSLRTGAPLTPGWYELSRWDTRRNHGFRGPKGANGSPRFPTAARPRHRGGIGADVPVAIGMSSGVVSRDR